MSRHRHRWFPVHAGSEVGAGGPMERDDRTVAGTADGQACEQRSMPTSATGQQPRLSGRWCPSGRPNNSCTDILRFSPHYFFPFFHSYVLFALRGRFTWCKS
jgi:hypothetical protein